MTGLADWAPNPHALIVHLPIGLLVTAVVVDLLAVVRRDRATLRLVATGLHVGGTAMLAAAWSMLWRLPGPWHASQPTFHSVGVLVAMS